MQKRRAISYFGESAFNLVSRRKGRLQISQCGVVALAKGGAIACKRRLALTNLKPSDTYNLFNTAH